MGCSRDVPKVRPSNGDSQEEDIEPKGNGVWIHMMIYLLLHIYKQVGVLVGLTPKELNWVMHRAKRFKWEGNTLLHVCING